MVGVVLRPKLRLVDALDPRLLGRCGVTVEVLKERKKERKMETTLTTTMRTKQEELQKMMNHPSAGTETILFHKITIQG